MSAVWSVGLALKPRPLLSSPRPEPPSLLPARRPATSRALARAADSGGPVLSSLVRHDRRVPPPSVEPLDPGGAPGRRLPGLAEVDPLADDLAVAELHDANGHHGLVVVSDRVLVDPEVVAAGGPVQLELLAGRIGRPEPDDVRLAAQALAALRPFHDSVVGVDLRRARDVIAWPAAGGADVRRVEMRLDHGSRGRLIHRKSPSRFVNSPSAVR